MSTSRLVRRLQQIATDYRGGMLAHADAVRQCVCLGFTPSEADAYLSRLSASTVAITALAPTNLS